MLFFTSLISCVPQSQTAGVNTGNSTDTGNETETTPVANFGDPVFPLPGIFIQEGLIKTSTNFPLPINFTDSFLIRGAAVSSFLRKLPNTTKICLMGKYTFSAGVNKFLLLSAKPKSFTDLLNKTTEFYLQVEPSNDQANQNDCLTYNLTETLVATSTSPTFHFSLTQICSNCTTSITSSPLQLFFNNGEEVPNLSLNSLMITISGSISATTNSCVENSICKARNFDCCLQGQCVKDGAIRPTALTNPDFLVAQEDVKNNPTRFVVYPQFFFVCESRPEPEAEGAYTETTIDPNYEASIRLMELGQLYNCLNAVDGEFSYCTVKFTEASKLIPGNFSSSS
jgi:hypothetical protein